MSPRAVIPGFPALVQEFFCQRLIAQQNASARTVASYRDMFRLLLHFFADRRGRPPTALTLVDLDAPAVLAFLEHLERERGNSIPTRNVRLAALRSFLKYASARDPTCLPVVQRVLAIPTKRSVRPLLGYLSREEMAAVLAAPDATTWSGQRDRVLFALMYNTGARVSEAIGLRRTNVTLSPSRTVRIDGKGRKQRVIPLWGSTADCLRKWLSRVSQEPESPLFPNAHGGAMSRSGVEHRLDEAVWAAATRCPTLKGRRISPHTLRHTTAMHLLQSGVDLTVIAIWLGHESTTTTHVYVEADLAMKEKALSRIEEMPGPPLRYRAGDELLRFLDEL
jgi:site-specific recombinase XerD